MKLFTLLLAFLFTLVVSEDFVILKTEESKYTIPEGFKEGLPHFITPYYSPDDHNPVEQQLLLSTSNTISFMFGNATGATETILFREHPD